MVANCDICGQPVTNEFTARGGKFLHVSCLFQEWCERGAEVERLKELAEDKRKLYLIVVDELGRMRTRVAELELLTGAVGEGTG